MNIVSYPVNFMRKYVSIYSKQFIHLDNTWKKIELYRLNQSKTEAQNLTIGLHRDVLATVNFS